MSTVVGYIFNAIRQEDLPFNVGRAWKLAPHGHRFFKKGYMALIFSKTLGRGEETTGREEIENEAEGKGLGEDDKASTEENIREADSDTASGS